MIQKQLVVGPFQCNCQILACPKTGQAVLVDPGDEAVKILQQIEKLKTSEGLPIQVKYLLHTHGHLDHIGATRSVYESLSQPQFKPKIALHREDDLLYTQLKMQGQIFGFSYQDPLPIDHFLEDREILQVGELKFSVIHNPGHSPGSVSFRVHSNQAYQIPEILFSGDTLFKGSVGRTDLWGGDQELMFRSIRQRLLVLDDDTVVCPGHGPDTSIGIEKRKNPFLQ